MTQPLRVRVLGLFALTVFAHLLDNPLAAAPTDELAERLVGIGSVEPADDLNLDGAMDAADVVSAFESVQLTIDSTTPAGAVTANALQTLTFTFDNAVSGFTADDVTVTGATKGAFTPVSSTFYTLVVTGTGGTVTVSVPEETTIPSNTSATFSNFYQDTWTITLQTTPSLVTMELIRIPAGTFTMGSPEDELSRGTDETQHTVTLTQDFYLGRTEVTQDQWAALQPFPEDQSFVGGTMPVHNVSHDDIAAWLPALDAAITEPGTFSLPTESQWEYAARAGTTTRFNFGDGLGTDEFCATGGERETNMWYCGNNSPDGTKTVGQNPPNAWGLQDMHGNVSERCSDWYGTYPGTVSDPTGPSSGKSRVFRGGGWDTFARACRSAQRFDITPSDRFANIGFRVLAVR
ncbi:MAG: SUMF1/EgtB/PvdO family nonheme iron enzyme [Candidatus Sumerlaeia bacterium]|nr:SUMF1/EgtB/PvdO family nonheme iron enzyme [Candidatus Sumerlaeia bacterium]